MRRLSPRTLTALSLVALLGAASAPATAKSSRPKQHRGKKAVGEIVSFDEATMTLTVDLSGDEDFTGAVDPDVQVKLDHRGWARKGGEHGNPTKGSTDDLLPGTPVLRMKVEDDLVTKIRIRPLPDEAPLPPAEGDDTEDDDTGDAAPGDGTPGDDVNDTSGGPTDDPDSNPDDESDGDTEDALPPLPVPQP